MPPSAVEAPAGDFEARIEDGDGVQKSGDEVDFAKVSVAEAFKLLDVSKRALSQHDSLCACFPGCCSMRKCCALMLQVMHGKGSPGLLD